MLCRIANKLDSFSEVTDITEATFANIRTELGRIAIKLVISHVLIASIRIDSNLDITEVKDANIKIYTGLLVIKIVI